MMPRLGAAVWAATILSVACTRTPREEIAVQRWLLCQECVEGELAAVVALADTAVGVLGRALKGPPPAGIRNMRSQMQDAYRPIPAPLVSESVYVNHFVDNYVATYQSRAAIALAEIGTPRAQALLLSAAFTDSTSRADVRRVLDAMAPVASFAVSDTVQEAPVDSPVASSPSIRVVDGRAANRPPLAGARVSFRIESGGGRVEGDSIVRTSANGVATIRWRLGPGIDSLNTLRVDVAGGPVYFRATGRDAGLRLAFVTQPGNVQRGDTLSTAVRVAVLNGYGRPDSTFAGTVELFLPGSPFAVSQAVTNGAATFSGLSFNVTGSGLRLIARVTGARQAVSNPFDILP